MAKYKIIPSSRTIMHSPISIGHKAEKGVEAIEFDLTAWVEMYGSGTLTVIMRRWGDAIPYPIALEIGEDNKATWTLSDIDTAKAGMAYAQLNYIVGDEVVKKSDIYTFRVMDSLTGEGEPPEAYESWLEHLTHLAAEAMAEVLDIEGVVTDKTLTVDGGIADGKAAGDALALKADKSTTYTKTQVDQMIADIEVETDTTLSVSGKPADAAETGRQIGSLKADLTAKIINDITEEYSALNIESGYWDTTSGIKRDSSEWVRSNSLIPFAAITDTVMFSTCGYRVVIVCFDKNYEKMSQYAAAPVLGSTSIPKPIPAGTCYIALSVHDSAPTKISIAKIKALDSLEYPYADSYLIENYWMRLNGTFGSADTYSCIMIPVIPGERYYTNSILEANFICFDATAAFIGEAGYNNIDKHGRIYTIPENAVFAYVNISHNRTHGTTYSTVLYKVTKNKSILCIGDSITYLDGETNTDYDSASLFLGYQKVFQKAGYKTVSAGYSGYTYATNVMNGSKAIGSIYTKIVTEQYDVSGYDYILLAAGTNDDLYGVTIGDVPTDYQDYNYNTDTTAGALAAIIKYIRDNNVTAKIILCTILKSRATSRSFVESSLYAEMIRQMANFASCYLCDNYQNYNVQPYSDGWGLFFYDGTHPNKVGMERLGKLMLDAIEAS